MRIKLKLAIMFTIMMCTQIALAQSNTVTGNVTDDSGLPLPGVNVIIDGTSNGTTTDFDGKYTIDNINIGETLTFTYVGYTTQNILFGGQSEINVTLSENASALDEVVLVGYGTQKRSDVTTAISTVTGDEISEIPVADIAQSLQGRAAGVVVTNGGSPGEKTNVNIRGLGTFGNGDPLYVIDGVFTNSLNNIDPASIKKIDILKDAAASAIYGSRGSNGVVLITTEKGSANKTTFKISTYGGLQQSNKRYDVLNTEQYIQYIKEINAQADGGGTTVPIVDNNPDFDGNGVETDWQDELFRTAQINSVNFSASGGSDTAIYSFGASSFDQDGIYIDTNFKRRTFNANSQVDISDDFRVGETFALGFTDRIAPQASDGREPLFNVLASAPYTRVRNPDGTFSGQTFDDNNNSRNQIRVQASDDNLTRNTTIIGSLFAEYDLADGLTFRSQLGIDAFYTLQDNILRAYDEGGQFSKPDTNVSKRRINQISTIFTNSLSYNKTFGEGHNFDATIVSERQDIKNENLQAASINDVSSQIPELVASGAATSSITEEEILISYLGRLNYNYKGRYLLSASIRRDKSSIFAFGEQEGYFPAASIGWVPTKEAFLEDNEFLTNLKFRASYGETGNNRVGRYQTVSTLASVFNYPLNGQLSLGTSPQGLDNPILTWEKSVKQNYGFELGLLNNKYTFGFDYYNNENKDLLINEFTAPSLGVPDGVVARNSADVTTSGYELTLGYNDYEGDFKWNVWANVTTTESVVNSTGSVEQLFQANFLPLQTRISRIAEGEPLYHFYGYIYEGVYSTNQDIIDDIGADNLDPNSGAAYQVQQGDARYRDINGDGDITDADRVVIGNPNPDFTYSMNINASYKGFDLSALITGVEGVDAFNGNLYNLESQETVLNRGVAVLNRWQQPGDITDVPRFRFGQNQNNAVSTRYIEDASYTRLRNLTLGYSFDPGLFKGVLKGAISKVRIYIQGQNLVTVTDYSGLDPEIEPFYNAFGLVEGLNIDRGRAPQPSSFLTGIQVEF